MSDQASPIPFEDVPSAPTVYFDGVAANGVMNSAIQIELAQRIVMPVPGTTDVTIKFAISGRLRCSPHAARGLIEALTNALAMLEQPQEPTAAASKLN